MTDAAPAEANADQLAYWNDAPGRTWAELQAVMDVQLKPIGDAVIAALAPRPGERIVDVGCGNGQTTLDLADAVGPEGSVLGADISRPMLAVAHARTPRAGSSAVEFRFADVQTEAFAPQSFDGAFSRFGVMFFDDPVAAFANLRKALKPGGRLAFVCWRPMADNPMFTEPMAAALRHLPAPAPPQPGAPGPFAFSDPERVRAILDGAGFEAIKIEPLNVEITAGPLEDALSLTLRVGPIGTMLREHPDKRDAVIEDLSAVLRGRAVDGRVRFPSATWLVTATAP